MTYPARILPRKNAQTAESACRSVCHVTSDPAAEAHAQYGASTGNLDRRVAIHAYGTNPESWPAFVRALLPLRAGELVVDVGAGTGMHWQHPTVVRPLLLDLHVPMCEALRALGHHVVQASAEALPLAAACVDGVLCTHVLYHVPDPQRAIDEMLRALRPGGWIAVASNGPRHMQELDDLLLAAGIEPALAHHQHFDIDDVVEALTDRGLSPARHDYQDHLEVPSPEPVVDYCRSLGPGLDETAASALTDVVRRRIGADGHVRITKETALVVARR
jgi:SAM-dependent methyltransferase